MKRLIRWLIGIAITVGIPIGLYYGFIHDVKEKVITYDEDYQVEDIFSDLLGNCLDNTKTDGAISLAISDTQLNNAFHNALKETPLTATLPQAYCEFKGGFYNFTFQIKNESFITTGTKVKIKTKLEEVVREDYDNQSCFVFSFKDVAIGRISNIQKVALPILKNFISNEQIKEAMGDKVHCTVDINKGEIVYPKKELSNDLNGFLNNEGSGDIPFGSLLNAFFDNDLLHLNTTAPNVLRFDVDCNPLAANSEYVEEYDLKLNDSIKHDGLTLERINNEVKMLLDTNPGKENDKSTIFKYLFKGYAGIQSSERAVIDALDFNVIDPSFNRTTYKGFDLQGESMLNVGETQMEALKTKDASYFTNDSGFDLLTFKETDINNYLRNSQVMGFNFLLSKEMKLPDSKTEYKTSYICIDNFYCNVYDEHTEFVVGLNINGFETTMIIPSILNKDESQVNFATNSFEIVYDMGTIKLGSVEMTEKFTDDICMILTQCTGDAVRMSKVGSKYQISFDFSSILSSSIDSSLRSVLSMCDFTYETKGSYKEDNGFISMRGKYVS